MTRPRTPAPGQEPKPVLAPLADPCPSCAPGDHPAVIPFLVTVETGDTVRGWYKHRPCGWLWSTWWPAAGGWPLRRENAPQPETPGEQLGRLIGLLASLYDEQAPEQAARNRAQLERGIADHDQRRRRTAA